MTFNKISYYFLLILSFTFILISFTSLYLTTISIYAQTQNYTVITYVSTLITLLATITIFIGTKNKKSWLYSFASGYIGIIIFINLYRAVVLQNIGTTIAGTILDLLFFLPIYFNKKTFFKGKLVSKWLYIGICIGVFDLVFSILRNTLTK